MPLQKRKNKKLLVVLPTYNEKENLPKLLNKLFKVKIQQTTLNAIVVDDNSPDGTGKIAKQLSKTKFKNKLFLISRKGKLGLGTAYIAGFKYGIKNNYDYIMTMDADLSHNPKYIPNIVKKMEDNDLCIGSRYVPGGATKKWGIQRVLISSGANTLAHIFLGLNANDCTSGFRCYRRKVLEAIDIDNIYSNGYSFLMEMLYKCQKAGFKIAESPIVFDNRVSGESKISKNEILKAGKTFIKFSLDRAFK